MISKIGINFALGILLADLFIHILPEIYEKVHHSHEHGKHEHNWEFQISCVIMISFFILIENFKNHNHGKNRKIIFLLKDILHNLSDAITVITVYKMD